MRKELAKLNGSRLLFSAVFGRYGTKTNYNGFPQETIMLADVRFENGDLATEHIWFTVGKRLESIGHLSENDKISFEARINTYRKGYYKDDFDYKLSNPTKIKKLYM